MSEADFTWTRTMRRAAAALVLAVAMLFGFGVGQASAVTYQFYVYDDQTCMPQFNGVDHRWGVGYDDRGNGFRIKMLEGSQTDYVNITVAVYVNQQNGAEVWRAVYYGVGHHFGPIFPTVDGVGDGVVRFRMYAGSHYGAPYIDGCDIFVDQ